MGIQFQQSLPPLNVLLGKLRSGLQAQQIAGQYDVTKGAVSIALRPARAYYRKVRQGKTRERLEQVLNYPNHLALLDLLAYAKTHCPRLYSSKWLVKALIRYTKLHPTWKVEAKTARRARIAAREQAKLAKPG